MGKNARELITVRSKVQVLPGPLQIKDLRHFLLNPKRKASPQTRFSRVWW